MYAKAIPQGDEDARDLLSPVAEFIVAQTRLPTNFVQRSAPLADMPEHRTPIQAPKEYCLKRLVISGPKGDGAYDNRLGIMHRDA